MWSWHKTNKQTNNHTIDWLHFQKQVRIFSRRSYLHRNQYLFTDKTYSHFSPTVWSLRAASSYLSGREAQIWSWRKVKKRKKKKKWAWHHLHHKVSPSGGAGVLRLHYTSKTKNKRRIVSTWCLFSTNFSVQHCSESFSHLTTEFYVTDVYLGKEAHILYLKAPGH